MALQYLHGLNIVHMDLKSANILVDKPITGDNELNFNVKLCDFGLAMHVNPSTAGEQRFAGTLEYMAPECVKQKENSFIVTRDAHYVNEKVDVWALGCIVYELICGVTPFVANSDSRIFRNIIESNVRFYGQVYSQENVAQSFN